MASKYKLINIKNRKVTTLIPSIIHTRRGGILKALFRGKNDLFVAFILGFFFWFLLRVFSLCFSLSICFLGPTLPPRILIAFFLNILCFEIPSPGKGNIHTCVKSIFLAEPSQPAGVNDPARYLSPGQLRVSTITKVNCQAKSERPADADPPCCMCVTDHNRKC